MSDTSWAPIEAESLKLVLVAGPYIGDGSEAAVEANIQEAESYAIALANAGIGFFCPHTHTRHFQIKAQQGEPFYHRLDFQYLMRSDAILFMPRWRDSGGARREHEWAEWRKMPIFYPSSPEDIDDIIAWNRDQPGLNPVELESLAAEAVCMLTDFSTLPGWNDVDETLYQALRGATIDRRLGTYGFPRRELHERLDAAKGDDVEDAGLRIGW